MLGCPRKACVNDRMSNSMSALLAPSTMTMPPVEVTRQGPLFAGMSASVTLNVKSTAAVAGSNATAFGTSRTRYITGLSQEIFMSWELARCQLKKGLSGGSYQHKPDLFAASDRKKVIIVS